MGDVFTLDKKYVDEMISHARAEYPNECCGILAGVNGQMLKLYRSTNADHSPYHYTVEPNELIAIYQEIEEKKWEFLAVYHSHTHTEAFPSAVDIKSAFFPQSLYLIISLSNPEQAVIRAFRINQGEVTEIEMKIVEG